MSSRQISAAAAAAPLAAASAAAQVFATLGNAQLAAVLGILGTNRLEAKKFLVRASGTLTTSGAAVTANPFLAVGTSLTAASDTIVAQPGTAATIATTSCPWWIEANLIYDSTSGKLQGDYTAVVNNTVVAAAALNTVVTGLSSKNDPVFSMVAGVTFSTASTGNIATLAEFVLEN